jgi:hypothetical protein
VVNLSNSENKILNEADPVALKLCYVLEMVLGHGLLEGVFSKPTIWDYLQHIKKCLPGGQAIVDKITNNAKSGAGIVYYLPSREKKRINIISDNIS